LFTENAFEGKSKFRNLLSEKKNVIDILFDKGDNYFTHTTSLQAILNTKAKNSKVNKPLLDNGLRLDKCNYITLNNLFIK